MHASELDPRSQHRAAKCFPRGTYSPVNTVAIAIATTATDETAGDPGLLDHGKVGLLKFPTGSGVATETAEAPADADDILGGYLPELIVPETGDLARRFKIEPGGTKIVVLLGFATLSASTRASVRSDIA